MFCEHCGTKMEKGAVFCPSCGKTTSETISKIPSTKDGIEVVKNPSVAVIRCGNCGYEGQPESGRNIVSTILAWVCVFFAAIITIIYYIATSRYQCPKCKSTFVGIKNKNGVFIGQQSGFRSPIGRIFLVLLVIAIIGILSSVVLASLNTARQKGEAAKVSSLKTSWETFNSVADKFSVSLPTYPTSSSKSDTTHDDIAFKYNMYMAASGSVSYHVIKYIYSEEMDFSEPDLFLERSVNGFANGSEGVLITSNYTFHNSYRSLDFLVKLEDEYLKGRMILVGQTPYLLVVDYPAGINVEADYQKFIRSFITK